MIAIASLGLAMAALIPPISASAGPATQAPAAAAPDTTGARVRIFFLADAHSRQAAMDRFVEEANRAGPDLVLDGGDFVHDGTEAEFRRALADRARLEPVLYMVRGNHDAKLRGPFARPPPEIPEFRAVDHGDLRLILLDNHAEVITDELFRRLEAELAAHPGRRIVVVMHVPAMVRRQPFLVRLRHLLPYRLASPVMREPAQVERFTALMERHGVLAVLAGHTHAFDHFVSDGVHYIVTGALGGLTPGLRIGNEFLDIELDGRDVSVRRVGVTGPARDPVRFVYRAFRFFSDLNRFNHAEQGWGYVPSVSVQVRTALTRIEAADREDAALYGAAVFERLLGERGRQSFHGDLGLYAGDRALAGELALGYRLRPIGDFNRSLFVEGAVAGTAGRLAGAATAGVGAQLGTGWEWEHFTADLSRTWATNHRGTRVGLGYRF